MIIEDKRYEIDEVFHMIGEEYLSLDTDKGKKNSDIVVDGFRVHPISLRYMTFYRKTRILSLTPRSMRYLQFRMPSKLAVRIADTHGRLSSDKELVK
jgi:hypothetical protein